MKRLLVVVAVVACSKGKQDVVIDVAAVNALVPPELKDKLVFEKRQILTKAVEDETYTLAAPKGWEQEGNAFAKLRGPDNGRLLLSASCGLHDCGKADNDWAAISDRELFSQIAQVKRVVRDDKAVGRRTMVATDDDAQRTEVAVAWWKAGDRHYRSCTFRFDTALAAAAPAFERACLTVVSNRD